MAQVVASALTPNPKCPGRLLSHAGDPDDGSGGALVDWPRWAGVDDEEPVGKLADGRAAPPAIG